MKFRDPSFYSSIASGGRSTFYIPPDVVAGDFDKDGDIDLLVGNFDGGFGYGSVVLLKNNGFGSFSPATQISPEDAASLAAGDVNGDGNLDFVRRDFDMGSAGFPSFATCTITTYLGNGDGTFVQSTISRTKGDGSELELGDLNGDGKSDIILGKQIYPDGTYTNAVSQIAVTLSVTGAPAANEIITDLPGRVNDIAAIDLDGDNRLDLAVATSAGVSILLGDGAGHFQRTDYALQGGARHVAAADFNNDGKVDLGIGGALWINNGAAAFSQVAVLPASWSVVDAHDLDGDGLVDIVASNGNLAVFRNLGGTSFGPAEPVQINGNDLAIADFDRDGFADMAATTSRTDAGVLVSIQVNSNSLVPDDFDGDGRSDILWRNVNGTTHIWEMNGTTQVGGGNTSAQLSSDWKIEGTGDFDGDGNTDLLWRNTAGETRVWRLDRTNILSQQATNSQAPTTWKVQDVADFNGDGKADILWRHDSGTTNIWLMDGATQIGGTNTNSQAGNAWQVQGAGDFNGDGRADILWRNDDGRTHIWFMNGDQSQPGTGDTSFALDNSWKFEEIGDFNGDLKADILWRNDDGRTRISLMDGRNQIGGGNTVSQTSNFWEIEEVGDYNGDGKSDILWRNDTGATFMWLMDGVNDIGSGYTNSQTSLDWHIA